MTDDVRNKHLRTRGKEKLTAARLKKAEPQVSASFTADQPIVVKGSSARGRIVGFSGGRLHLRLRRAVPRGHLLQIEWDRAMITGEVTHCWKTSLASYAVDMKIAQVIEKPANQD